MTSPDAVLDWQALPARTAPYAEVIGDPISHSKSPLIHNFWIETLGLDAHYRAAHVTPDTLAAYVAARSADPHWRGANVTIPHKVAVTELVADPGKVGQSIGAMNTLFRVEDGLRSEDGSIAGTNTDAAGFVSPLLAAGWEGTSAAIVGSGGAARAMLFGLKQIGVTDFTIIARNALKAMGLLSQIGVKGRVIGFDAPLPPVALLANASPMGMKGQDTYAPDLSPLPKDAVVYDAVYAPLETPLLAAADTAGLAVVDGLEMLVGQAAAAFAIFFGVEAPREHDDELWALLTA